MIYLCQVSSYLLTGLVNQGLAINNDMDIETEVRNKQICPYCKNFNQKGEGIEHCIDCGICIEGMFYYIIGFDHHCPWTSKCIGRGNIKYFYMFIISTFTLLLYIIFSLISTN